MGIRESLLNTITSVGNSDFVRIVTSAGVSSKATVQNLFKSFETGLGAKSSLTTSDYIRVVGSDNNLYKQSVSDVANNIITTYAGATLGSSAQTLQSAIGQATNRVPFLSSGTIYQTVKNKVLAGQAFGILVTGTAVTDAPSLANYKVVYICGEGTNDITLYAWLNANLSQGMYWCRFHASNDSALNPWEKLPTRSEIDALKSKITIVNYYTEQINSGYIRLSYPDGYGSGNKYIVQPLYASGGLTGWTATLQTTGADIIAYIRQGSTTPTDGSKISFELICIK